MDSLKKKILELLDKDLEFRYAVAGYLGLSEVLKRLENLSEEQVKLREELIKLGEEQVRLREEQIKLREEQIRLREDFNKMLEDFNKMREDFNRMLTRLGRVERTLEKLTVDVEDEARSIVKHRLKEMGISLELTSLTLPDLELNLYGVSDDVCVIGEATVRAGAKLADELLEKLDKLKKNYPEKLRRKIIPIIYVSLPMPDLIEKAKEKNIWLLKATGDLHKPEKTPL